MNPMLNIARELAGRGHKVTLATCKFLADKIGKTCQEAGISFVGIAEDVISGEIVGSPTFVAKQKSVTNLYRFYNAAMLVSLTAAVRAIRPDVILTDFLTTCGYEAGLEVGIPVAFNFADPVTMG